MRDRRNLPHSTLKAPIAGAALAQRSLLLDIEPLVTRHFIESYYRLVINPDSHSDFYTDWLTAIQCQIPTYDALRYSVLSNAASHLYFTDDTASMQDLALSYYSKSLESINIALRGSWADRNALHANLTAIILLYLHGVSTLSRRSSFTDSTRQCMGLGTDQDIPVHLGAAVAILDRLWFSNTHGPVISNLFDRLAAESVVYQLFLVGMGLWSDTHRESLTCNADVDLDRFWERCEAFLERTQLFPELTTGRNSPVLGVPFSLFKLLLRLRKLLAGADVHLRDAFSARKAELREWEQWVDLFGDSKCNETDDFSRGRAAMSEDTTRLYLLIASLITDQLIRRAHKAPEQSSENEQSWQLRQILSIMDRRRDDPQWLTCYLGNWPIYTIGRFLTSNEAISSLRQEMRKRWEIQRLSQVKRYWTDLEKFWSAKDR